MISILIPTHNRPEKFHRLLASIQRQTYEHFEVIINNDSNDVDIHDYDSRFSIEYNKFDDLTALYQSLYDRASGSMLWVVEDDDYLAHDHVLCGIVGKFTQHPTACMLLGAHYNKTNNTIVSHDCGLYTIDDIRSKYICDECGFQYSDMVLKRQLSNWGVDLSWITDKNHMGNDYEIFKHWLDESNGDVICTKDIIYVLTYANDNLTWGPDNARMLSA